MNMAKFEKTLISISKLYIPLQVARVYWRHNSDSADSGSLLMPLCLIQY